MSTATTIENILRQLGLNGTYSGFRFIVLGVELALDDPSLLLAVTTRLYPQVGEHFGTNKFCVERNIRTVIDNIWDYGDRKLLTQLANHTLHYKPTNAQFLDMLTSYVRRRNEAKAKS